MMKTNPVIWFEIPVANLEAAKKFYESVFGYDLVSYEMGPMKMAMFPMLDNVPGATGSLVKAEGYITSQTGSLVYFCVDDIETTLRKINAAGGKVIQPKTSIGEHGFIAHFADCEGNI
ncbi:MAG: VOC family protein [Negativicutes bacterium]